MNSVGIIYISTQIYEMRIFTISKLHGMKIVYVCILVVCMPASIAYAEKWDRFDGYPETDVVSGHITRVIDGNTIVIDGIKIRSPFIDVVDSGNSTTAHAALATALCPVGSKAHYNIDDWQPVGYYGRTIALVYCDGMVISIDRIMMLSGNGWVNQQYCHLSEFASLEWVRCQE